MVEFGPQLQAAMDVPATGGTTLGAKITAPVVGITLAPKAAVANTRMAPLPFVATVATYFEVDTDDSQPQLPAVGSEPVCAVCTDSVILVRHAEAANIISVTFARTV